MRTEVKGSIKIERIPGTQYVRLFEDFHFFSVILARWCCIPKGFVYDEESIPVVRGSNPEAGAIHDYLSRRNSVPVVGKDTAAAVYEEFQIYYDDMEKGFFNRLWDWIRRLIKTDAVELTPGYFHRHSVTATYEDLEC